MKWSGFALGAAAFAPLLAGWSIDGGTGSGAVVALTAQRHADLDVEPARELARKTLRPSTRAAGVAASLTARNATARPLAVRIRVGTETRALDSALRIRVTSGTRSLFTGGLASLRRGVDLGVLPSHATLSLRVQAWIPAGAATGFEARQERLDLSFATGPA